ALVMATGIVSIATYLHGIPVLPRALFWLNALFLAGLVAATCARILRYSREFAADIQNHSRAVGFFTTAAATAVFGTQLVLLPLRPSAKLGLSGLMVSTAITP